MLIVTAVVDAVIIRVIIVVVVVVVAVVVIIKAPLARYQSTVLGKIEGRGSSFGGGYSPLQHIVALQEG